MAMQSIKIKGRTGPEGDAPADRVAALIYQLDAATAAVCAEGFAGFSSLNSDLQENYLWMLHDLAARARFAQQEAVEDEARKRQEQP